jgi:hypothetical protein
VSLRTRKQDAKAAARAGAKNARQQAKTGAKNAREQAKTGAKIARQRARQASTQVTPLAQSARQTARDGVHGARVWAAPRVEHSGHVLQETFEHSGHVLQERVAPKVSDMLAATARRLEPDEPIRRRRWPKVLAGIVMLGVGTAVAAVLRGRLGSGSAPATQPDDSPRSTTAPAGPLGSHQAADGETADVNGQVRTP